MTINNLSATITKLKQNLTAESEKLKRRKSIRERKYVNRIFKVSPKKIYREMRDGSKIKVSQMPEQSKVEDFWSSVWSIPLQHNAEAHWLNEIREEYCKYVNPKPYVITDEILNIILSKMANDKPGRDLIPGLWIKRLTSTRGHFKQLLISIYNLEQDYPQWLILSKTLLITKNEHTEEAQNYRPIVIQNSMYKVFTAIISEFIMDHCTTNNIVTEEQAAGKIGNWGCTGQLLINKIVCEEVTKNRRNLTTAWLDYRKAFDSVPHSWIIETLQLAKDKIIDVIKMLMSKWRTKLYLYGDKATIETSEIEYRKRVLQGDMLSLILFVLSVNPLSYILHKKEGYKLGTGAKRCNLSNLFFVDDLKLYAIILEQLINLLKIIVEYSEDVGMSFRDNKCAYQCIQRGKRKEIVSPLRVDHLTVQKIKEGDNYKYLGTDESVGFDGPLNKERVIKEYKRRVNRIWRS